jgi:eukaryotic-like serine/threonine-protein kinase
VASWVAASRAKMRSFYTGDVTRLDEYGTCAADKNLELVAWYCHNSGGLTHPVGTLQPNAFGLFDMHGNVAEWVNDRNTGEPPEAQLDPGGLLENNPELVHPGRIYRGGNYRSWSTLCRAAYKSSGSWDDHAPGIGFRLARSLGAK